jgi:hypothetical protein
MLYFVECSNLSNRGVHKFHRWEDALLTCVNHWRVEVLSDDRLRDSPVKALCPNIHPRADPSLPQPSRGARASIFPAESKNLSWELWSGYSEQNTYCTGHSGSVTFFVLTDFFNPEWWKTDQNHNKISSGHPILTADVRTTDQYRTNDRRESQLLLRTMSPE